jgi:hypothetical protein
MKYTVIFSGTCVANGELTLCSKRINFPFMTKKFVASFALGTDRTLKLRYFLSPDSSEPATGKPTGINLFGIFGEDPYLIGDDEQKVVEHETRVKEKGYYIKVYANNTDSFDHTVDVFVVIESLED